VDRTRLPLAGRVFPLLAVHAGKYLAIVSRLPARAIGCGNGLERGDWQEEGMSEFCGIGLRAFLGDNEGYEREQRQRKPEPAQTRNRRFVGGGQE